MSTPLLIPLHGKAGEGLHALVDAGDFESLSRHRWYLAKVGYAVANIRDDSGKRRVVYMHHLVIDANDGRERDHINGDKLDNRKSNLRVATRSQNNANSGPRKHNLSGVKGLRWLPAQGKWQARLTVGGTSRHLGNFDSLNEAAEAYRSAAVEAFGEFANTRGR